MREGVLEVTAGAVVPTGGGGFDCGAGPRSTECGAVQANRGPTEERRRLAVGVGIFGEQASGCGPRAASDARRAGSG